MFLWPASDLFSSNRKGLDYELHLKVHYGSAYLTWVVSMVDLLQDQLFVGFLDGFRCVTMEMVMQLHGLCFGFNNKWAGPGPQCCMVFLQHDWAVALMITTHHASIFQYHDSIKIVLINSLFI